MTQTWLTPYFAAWEKQFTASPTALAGTMAKVLRPLETAHGATVVLEQFVAYLAATPIQYVSLPKFSAGFGTWTTPQKAAPRFATQATSAAVVEMLSQASPDGAGATNAAVAMLATGFPVPAWDSASLALYGQCLADLDPDMLKTAVMTLLRTRTDARRPTIAEVRDAVRRQLETAGAIPVEIEPDQAWAWVVRCFTTVGRYRAFPVQPYPLVAQAVSALGWETLCGSENQEADRAHFHRAYLAMLTRSRTQRLASPTEMLVSDQNRLIESRAG